MTSDRLESEMRLLESVLRQPSEKRRAYIDRVHAEAPETAKRMHRLLDAHLRSREVNTAFDASALTDAGAFEREMPTTIGPYRVLERIGEGGMGSVYKAEQHESLNREVAVKVIKPGMDSQEILARFEAERQALAVMDHPGIARVFDAGMSDSGQPYFAMELVVGQTLIDYVRARGLSLQSRLRLFIGVCNAVQHAHQKGVIHRDLKPSNVLVSEVDGEPTAKIIDFGIAKAVSGRLIESTLITAQGGMIGTPEYMSPEQAQIGASDIDTRSDVYSLGVMLYEILTGALPFESDRLRANGIVGAQKIIRELMPPRPSLRLVRKRDDDRVAEANGPAPSELNARDLRGDLDAIVMRCLEKERSERYASPGDLAQDIQRFLSSEPVEAGPPSTLYRIKKFVRRRRTGVILTGVAAALILSGSIVLAGALLQSMRSQRDAATKGEIAQAVNAFLLNDLLAAADPGKDGRNVTVAQVLDRASETASERFSNQPAVEAQVRLTLGRTYTGLGRFDAALREIEAADALLERSGAADFSAQLDVLRALSGVRIERGEAEIAEGVLNTELEIAIAQLGREHARTLTVKGDLALLYEQMNRYDAAERLLLEIYTAQIKALDDDHPDLLRSVNNLAVVYQATGRFEEAEPFALQAAEMARRVYGDDHPTRFRVVEGLGWLYMNKGDLLLAEQTFQFLHDDRVRYLGSDHPDTVLGMLSTGECLRRQGKFAESVELLKRCEAAAERSYDNDSWMPAQIQSQLGDVMIDAGLYEDAEQRLLASHARFARVIGANSSRALIVVDNLVRLYETTGRDEEAAMWAARRLADD